MFFMIDYIAGIEYYKQNYFLSMLEITNLIFIKSDFIIENITVIIMYKTMDDKVNIP